MKESVELGKREMENFSDADPMFRIEMMRTVYAAGATILDFAVEYKLTTEQTMSLVKIMALGTQTQVAHFNGELIDELDEIDELAEEE